MGIFDNDKAQTENKRGEVKKGDTKRDSTRKSSGNVFGVILTFLSLVIAVSVLLGGAFYTVIHYNINGLAERYRSTIQNIPVARLALPEPKDPEDPEYMTDDEIKEAYLNLKTKNAELEQQLSEAKETINELQELKEDFDAHKASLDTREGELDVRAKSLDDREEQLNQLKETIDGLIANGNPEAFIEYFEELDEARAEEIFKSLIIKQQADENVKKFIKLYESMEPDVAAAIFEEMGSSKINLIAETLMGMNRTAASDILAAMSPEFAAQVTEKLNSLYKETADRP